MSYEAFEQTCKTLGASRKIAEFHAQLVAALSDKGRVFHSLGRVTECLRQLESARDLAKHPEEVALALWFQDVVYKSPAFFSNKNASARIAELWCRAMLIPEASVVRIATMIRSADAQELGDVEQAPDLALFRDIRLAILGAYDLTYAAFEREVREEYRWVPLENMYTSSRAKALRRFLERKPLYATERFRAQFEAQARENMTRTIPLLEALKCRSVRTNANYFYCLSYGRLSVKYPWSSLASVTCQPEGLYCAFRFMRMELPGGAEDLIDGDLVPWSDEASIARIRSLPNYDIAAEAKGANYVYTPTTPIPEALTGQIFR